jgi:predicted RNA binding protein YcfA (HicA-like mRNA interferase family)
MPSATAREFQRVASQLGFLRRRQTGSHERWNHPDGRAVTIPIHGGREIGPPSSTRSSVNSASPWMSSSASDRRPSSKGIVRELEGGLLADYQVSSGDFEATVARKTQRATACAVTR